MVRVLDIEMRDICEMGDICDIILWVWHDPEMICRAEQEHNIFLQSCTAKTESMGQWGIKWGGRDIWAESVLQGPYKQPCEGHTSRPSNPMRARHQLKSAQVTTSNSCRTKLEQPVLVYCDSGGRRIRVIWRMLPLSTTVPQWAGRMWSQPAPYREQRATASLDIVYHLCDHVIRMITTIHPKYNEHAFMKTKFTLCLIA